MVGCACWRTDTIPVSLLFLVGSAERCAGGRLSGIGRRQERSSSTEKGGHVHYCNLVIIETPKDGISEETIGRLVKLAMGPHEEQGGFWDFYQIGGRWTGLLDGYDPDTDPTKQEPCEYCDATGVTTEAVARRYPAYVERVGQTCIQCKGKKTRTIWPTEWGFRTGDVAPIASISAETWGKAYRIVSPSGTFQRERYEPWHPNIEDRFPEYDMPPLEWAQAQYPEHLVVVVDNHC